MEKEYDVFINYTTISTKELKIAEEIGDYLEAKGLRCFVAHRDIQPPQWWLYNIRNAIDKSRMMVTVHSVDSNSETLFDYDLQIDQASKNEIPILTFRTDNSDFKGAKKYILGNTICIDAFPKPDEAFEKTYECVCNLLNGTIPSRRPVPPTPPLPLEDKKDSWFKVGEVEFKMIYVEGGSFDMGSSSGYDVEKPVHRVTVDDYLCGETLVTQALWMTVMGDNPSCFEGDNLPVDQVSWDECQMFIEKLNQLTGKHFRLLTEAEWEYAARGGKQSKGYLYSGSDNPEEVAWYEDTSNDETHDVKGKKPNELGIYDMSGNVYEWCQDWYDNDYYSISPQNNPKGPAGGFDVVTRGGCYYSADYDCRVSSRRSWTLTHSGTFIGFRLAI